MSEQTPQAPGFWQTISSVLASFFGVQSSKNRERDFRHGKARNFIIVGLVMTVLFVLSIVLLVQVVLRSAGM